MKNRSIQAFVRAIPEGDSREVEFVISDSTKDRHSTVVNQDNWSLDNYKKNPIVGYNHNVYGGGFFDNGSPDDIIGKSEVFVDNGKLIGKVTFEPADLNPIADKILKKIKFGSLTSASVGFKEVGEGKFGEGDEAEGRADETYYFAGQELVEWSVVNIPSNPSATKRKDYKEPTLEDVISKYDELRAKYDEKELKSVSIIDLLKSMEGMKELGLSEKVVNKKLCELYEKQMHLINIA